MQFGKVTQIQFRREYLATNPLEDEDDDEYENDVPHEHLQPRRRGVQFGKGTQIQFRREYLATNPLEDGDDDEYENDVPHEHPMLR